MVQGSSVSTTALCEARIDGPNNHHLWIDGNGKITTSGTLVNPSPNAFSLLHKKDCPGSTATCRASCYVTSLEEFAPDVYATYRHNSETIRSILLDNDLATAWSKTFGQWISENCPGGFRWHVSGDIFSERYAQWITDVCYASPNINHWLYTRSFNFIKPLVEVENLTLNLSCDQDNWQVAVATAGKYQLRLCYMIIDGTIPVDLVDGDIIFPDYALRRKEPAGQKWFSSLAPEYKKMVCPVDFHEKSETRRCGNCRKCLI